MCTETSGRIYTRIKMIYGGKLSKTFTFWVSHPVISFFSREVCKGLAEPNELGNRTIRIK